MLWTFLFARFRKEDRVDERRAIGWELIHLPLHYCILLLLSAIVVSQSGSVGLERIAVFGDLC